MPLANDPKKSWTGWLVDGAGGREEEARDALVAALQARNMPKTEVKPVTVNMWWRKDSLGLDVTSEMDGKIVSTIHVQEYGTSLFVGRAADSFRQHNYYKRMASRAFLETVDRCIIETLDRLAPGKRTNLNDSRESSEIEKGD